MDPSNPASPTHPIWSGADAPALQYRNDPYAWIAVACVLACLGVAVLIWYRLATRRHRR